MENGQQTRQESQTGLWHYSF